MSCAHINNWFFRIHFLQTLQLSGIRCVHISSQYRQANLKGTGPHNYETNSILISVLLYVADNLHKAHKIYLLALFVMYCKNTSRYNCSKTWAQEMQKKKQKQKKN